MPRISRVAIVLFGSSVILLAAAACSDSGDERASETAPQVEVCPDRDEVKCQQLAGDVDGDGKEDRIGAYVTGCDSSVTPDCSVWLRVATADGGRLSFAGAGNSARIAGIGDIDGRPGGEIAIFHTSAASSQWGALLAYRDGELQPIEYADGSPFELAVAGSIINRIGLECRSEGDSRQLVLTHAQLDPPSADSTVFITGREVLDFDADGRLTSRGEEELRVAIDAQGNEPEEAKVGGLDCPGFEQFG